MRSVPVVAVPEAVVLPTKWIGSESVLVLMPRTVDSRCVRSSETRRMMMTG
jgi:hypothetical protein